MLFQPLVLLVFHDAFQRVRQQVVHFMPELNFRVDRSLCLVSCSLALEDRLGVSKKQLLNLPYVTWLPALRLEEEDAVQKAIEHHRRLFLQAYRFPALTGVLVADVVIEPLPDRSGAEIQIGPLLSEAPAPQPRWNDVTRVAAKLSHGVRNPLNAIKGAVTYLQGRYAKEAELQEFSAIIVEEISRLEQFVNGFLSTSGRGFAPEKIDVNPLLKKIASYVSLQARSAQVTLVLHCGAVPSVRVDAFQLEQAILNLVNNALAALAEGGRIVLSSHLADYAGEPHVVIKVADNGCGMDPERLAALRNPASEPEAGSEHGFGLYITRDVIASFGGRFEIAESNHRGTQIQLLLPALRSIKE